MSRKKPRAGWQEEACPAWCIVDHQDADHPHDRKHVCLSHEVPAHLLDERPNESLSPRDNWVAGTLSVVLHKRDGQMPVAIYIGNGRDQRIEIDATTADRLRAALADILRQ